MPAKFKVSVKALMLQKSAKTGERITQQEMAEVTGLSPATVSRWMSGSVERLDADLLLKFMKYFDCDYTDIIQGVEEAE